MTDIELKIKKIVSNQLGVPLENINNEHKFIDDLGGDSLDTVEMVLTLEDEFGFEVEEEVAERLFSVGDVVKLVELKFSAKS